MIYLFSDSGLAVLHDFIDSETLFAFDLDGTLAPIADDPGAIRVSAAVQQSLAHLKELAVLAVITGRSREDALRHLGVAPQYLVGNHGAEGLSGWEQHEADFRRLGDQWNRQLRQSLPDRDTLGIAIENKRLSVSIHYRGAVNRTAARSVARKAVDLLTPQPRVVGGKYVLNLLPAEAPNKGTALLQLLSLSGCRKGLFVGDDRTDEAVFQLKGDHLFTVRVGGGTGSRARYFLRSQREVPLLLRHIIAVLTQRNP
ncbi:MAG: trehalose-phosphatase [Deltaproteobacteria bacterium]|nr:trehalose-phosphatase [Deltaproteobacteria bacterium]